MSYNAITTIVNLLSTYHPEQMLIGKLNSFFNYDHNVFILVDGSEDIRNHFINTSTTEHLKEYTPQTMFVVNSANGNFTELENFTDIQSKHALVAVILQRISERNESTESAIINRIMKLQSSRQRLHIGLFFQQFVGEEYLLKLFQWCWERGIINIFAATNAIEEASVGSLNIFTFNPFGTFQVINVSADEQNIFLNQNSNFQQYPIRVYVYTYEIRPSDEKLWLTVHELFNSTVKIVEQKKDADISPILYYINAFRRDIMVYMYPLKMESEVLVVPKALPYSDFSIYLQSAASDEIFDYSITTIIALTVVVTILRFIKENNFLFLQSVADVINLLMNDNGAIKYQQLSRAETFVIVPLTFIGFIVVNGILSSLQSYLTRPILQPQIDDIDGIHQSDLKIFTLNEAWKNLLIESLQNQSIYRDWGDKINVIDVLQLNQEICTFNTSISFLWNLPSVKRLVRIQKRFNIRGYHIINADIYTHPLTYMVNERFPFTERLNDIVGRTKSAGLYDKWLRMEDDEYESAVLNITQITYSVRSVEQERFSLPMFIVYYGWIASVIVFGVEIFWEKFNFPLKKLVKRILASG